MKAFFNAFPVSAHPMAILSSAANAIATFYDAVDDSQSEDQSFVSSAMRLLAKMPTVAAWAYKKSIGQPYVYPAQRPRLRRELPQHDVRDSRRGSGP